MIFILLVVFQVKHFIADYPLQGKYMLGKFKDKGWIAPLVAHAGVHSLFTFLITYVVISLGNITNTRLNLIWQLPLIDFILHFVMDRIKADKKILGRFKALSANEYKMNYNISLGLSCLNGEPLSQHLSSSEMADYKEIGIKGLKSNTYFWWSLGLDQMVHHLTHYLLIWMLL